MREIKFRAWDRERKHFTDLYVGSFIKHQPHPQYILQQYTGLKDMNGNDIYEGDIVTYTYKYSDLVIDITDEKGIVVWDNSEMAWMTEPRESGNPRTPLGARENSQSYAIEVIGNIHENPELLESKS